MVPFDGGSPFGGSGADSVGADGCGSDRPAASGSTGSIGRMDKAK